MGKEEKFLNELGLKFYDRIYENMTGRKIDRENGNFGGCVSHAEIDTIKRIKELAHRNNINMNPHMWELMLRIGEKICGPLFEQADVLNIENKIGFVECQVDKFVVVICSDKVRSELDRVKLLQSDSYRAINERISCDLIEVVKPNIA